MREDVIRRARRLDRDVAVALAVFDEMPGALSTMEPAERALRMRAVDEAIERLRQAEQRRRQMRWQQVSDSRAYLELLSRLRRSAAMPRREAPVDALTGLRPGESARIVVHIDHASPQELASLSALVRSLPAGAVEIKRLRAARARPGMGPRRPIPLAPLPPSAPPAAG